MTLVPRVFLRLHVAARLLSVALCACAPNGPPPPAPPPLPGPAPGTQIEPAEDATDDGGWVNNDELDSLAHEGAFLREISQRDTEPTASDDADEALERRTFRQIVAGVTAFPPRRLTWELSLGARRARLELSCQLRTDDKEWLHVDGREQIEALWAPPVRTTFEGPRARNGAPARLVTHADLGPMWSCVEVVRALVLTCHPGTVPVHRVGAVLRGNNVLGTTHWDPGATQNVGGWSCTLARDPAGPQSALHDGPVRDIEWPLVFVRPAGFLPGIEWVYENSEGIVQAGAYRWMRPTR